MALRLVRQTSETPNITNKDDTIMTRYAYGGYNGFVKDFGNDCNYYSDNGIFRILSGRIVVDGWEVDIDGAGWSLDLSNVTGMQYHSVYLEINVSIESAEIKSSYLTGNYPDISKGDDLTATPNGIARLLLYQVWVQNGRIVSVEKKIESIPYLTQKVLDIENALKSHSVSDLPEDIENGTLNKIMSAKAIKQFVEEYYMKSYIGTVTSISSSAGSLSASYLVKQGNEVYLSLDFTNGNKEIGAGKHVIHSVQLSEGFYRKDRDIVAKPQDMPEYSVVIDKEGICTIYYVSASSSFNLRARALVIKYVI